MHRRPEAAEEKHKRFKVSTKKASFLCQFANSDSTMHRDHACILRIRIITCIRVCIYIYIPPNM